MTLQIPSLIMQSTVNEIQKTLNISNDNFIGAFLYGSQNYGLDYEDSDIDTIILIREANKPKQEKYVSAGKAKIYTLKYFIYRLKQGDLECYEILYTKYCIMNPLYIEYFADFVQKFSMCMNYERIMCALYKKLDEHLCHILWMLKNPEGARYNKKRLYWALRVNDQIERLAAGEDFASSLIYKLKDDYDLRKIKTEVNHLSLKQFNMIYKNLIQTLCNRPKFSTIISDSEEKCLSDLYRNIQGGKQ